MFLSQTVSKQEPSLAAAGSDLSCFTVLPSSPPGRVLLCSSSRAGDLWLCYGCTPSIAASLGQTSVLSSLVMHPHHPILSSWMSTGCQSWPSVRITGCLLLFIY